MKCLTLIVLCLLVPLLTPSPVAVARDAPPPQDTGAANTLHLPLVFGNPALAWTRTANMSHARFHHTATLLPNGQVLVTGGYPSVGAVPLKDTELYDPAANTWLPAAPMAAARASHTATWLPTGKLLVAGGLGGGASHAGSELFDPVTGVWAAAASMSAARARHTATLLPSGKVLVTGGWQYGNPKMLAAAEIYDPASDSWSPAASMSVPRIDHAAVLLPSGKVLVVGGRVGEGCDFEAYSSAELYDPESNTWSPAGNAGGIRPTPEAMLLPSGKVLVTGSAVPCGLGRGQADVYDPATNTWAPAPGMSEYLSEHVAVVLPPGKVLVVGGPSYCSWCATAAEVYNPAENRWTVVPGRYFGERPTGALLANGKVLIAGGTSAPSGGYAVLSAAWVYDPAWLP